MNQAQELWWKQAQPDFELFVHLRRTGFHECHSLHFLQMTTEKLSKAYFWRSGLAPPKVHTGFVRFLKALLDREVDLDRIATFLGFKRRDDLDRWVRNIQEVAYSVQNLSLAECEMARTLNIPSWPISVAQMGRPAIRESTKHDPRAQPPSPGFSSAKSLARL